MQKSPKKVIQDSDAASKRLNELAESLGNAAVEGLRRRFQEQRDAAADTIGKRK